MTLLIRTVSVAALLALPVSAEQGDFASLALSLVNDAREAEGLSTLEPGSQLAQAAERHAADMLERDYYGHVSPEGATARDRFLEAGGSRWQVVAENIARCEGCETPIGPEQVRSFQSGWMQSPGHRENILAHGIERFGFGVAAADGVAYAVQMFAGPGMPPGAAEGREPEPVPPEQAADAALETINSARAAEGQARLKISEDLNALALTLAEQASIADGRLDLPADTFGLLPEDAASWTSLAVSAGSCGGCGAFAAEGDAGHFATSLAPAEGANDFTRFGFAIAADGSGRKVAVGVYGRR